MITRRLAPAIILVTISQTSVPAIADAAANPIASIEAGQLEGTTDGDVAVFKGIPFAAPPVGAMRWRAPQPVAAWNGVRNATQDGTDCAQEPAPGIAAPLSAPLSEDCLYLNIWKPASAKADAKLPVIVWIHGGGFVNGGISPAVFDGKYFARHGIVMVSINYRLGRFGFFAHPALTAANADGGLLGNYGLMDQIAGLEWVQRNIAAFGGDASKVTIFGESAGGMSVNFLLASPLARGLFRAAIIQSGGGRGNLTGMHMTFKDRPGSPSVESLGVNFAHAQGIDGTGAEALAKLRALPVSAVVQGLNMFSSGEQATIYGGPSIDGRIVPQWPDAAFVSGDEIQVPVMVGSTSGDLGFPRVANKSAAFAQFGNLESAARMEFDQSGRGSDKDVIAAIARDIAMIEPARFIARMISSHGQPVFAFRFSYVPETKRGEGALAPHASDVPFVMGTVAEKYGNAVTAEDLSMSRSMNAYWANFARTGNPNGPGLPQWPRYDATADVIMEFAANGKPAAKPDPLRAQLDLVEAIQISPAAN